MKQQEEEFGPDRAIEIETDDEENEAERCLDHDDDTESDNTDPNQCLSNDCLDHDSAPFWPQSYRQSMDMYMSVSPPSVSFLRSNSSLISVKKRSQASPSGSSLSKPLISSTILDKEGVAAPIPAVQLCSASELGTSASELPQPELCSYTQSVLNAVNALCGIGILSTPYALKEGGWLSILLLIIFGAITCYTGILLKRCLESSSRLQTYPDIGQAAFGLTGRVFIAVILYIELYSSCVEFLIMMSDNLSVSFPNIQMDVAGIHLDSYQICAIISTLIILPTVWLTNLRLLSYISVGGVVTLAVVVLCLLWVGVASEVGIHPSGKALDFSKLPITIGIYSFCYGSHSVFPNIYSSMKDPSRFPSVITPVTKFGLSITPVALGLEELLPASYLRSHGVSLLIRTSLVVSTLIVALTVPYFGSIMALIGSFLVMLVSIVLPCACYMKIDKKRLSKLQVGTCSVIMVVGVFCAIIGTYAAVTSMGD
ncbi:Amino acid transporter [Handroanthus impetiginosus]|uniref:Amino acid transporter n=1 Tax=Handroanthus impetiginosus TaxID=429701 RepID=A0A2G9HHU3_9LAMI|nr:Amino acid transporter [Handroanthus impetiginosus]